MAPSLRRFKILFALLAIGAAAYGAAHTRWDRSFQVTRGYPAGH